MERADTIYSQVQQEEEETTGRKETIGRPKEGVEVTEKVPEVVECPSPCERRKWVEELISTECSQMHPVAKTLILKYAEVCHLLGVPFAGVKSIMHKIDYTGPVYFTKQYKTPQALDEAVLLEIERLLSMGVIEPSDSPYSSAILPLVKQSGSIPPGTGRTPS